MEWDSARLTQPAIHLRGHLIDRREREGEEPQARGEETGHQVSQFAKEDAECPNPIKTHQEEVTMRTYGSIAIRTSASPDARQAPGSVRPWHPPLHALGNCRAKAFVKRVGVEGEFLGLEGLGESSAGPTGFDRIISNLPSRYRCTPSGSILEYPSPPECHPRYSSQVQADHRSRSRTPRLVLFSVPWSAYPSAA